MDTDNSPPRPRMPTDGGPAFPVEHTAAHRLAIDAVKHIDREAFPNIHEVGYTEAFNRLCAGMSMRDLFALGAMIGDWASQNEHCGSFSNESEETDRAMAKRADLYYRQADLMLAARVKP